MKLILVINGFFMNEVDIPKVEFEKSCSLDFEGNVKRNEELLATYREQIKSMFFRSLAKARNYEIYAVLESRMNYMNNTEKMKARTPQDYYDFQSSRPRVPVSERDTALFSYNDMMRFVLEYQAYQRAPQQPVTLDDRDRMNKLFLYGR